MAPTTNGTRWKIREKCLYILTFGVELEKIQLKIQLLIRCNKILPTKKEINNLYWQSADEKNDLQIKLSAKYFLFPVC